MENVYFLDINDLEEYGFTNTNVDPKKLKPIILRTQRTRIEPIIGTTLYDKIVTDIKAATVAGLYKELLEDHIIPTLIAYVDWKATYHTTSQIMNEGTAKSQDQHMTPNTTDDNNNLRDELKQDAKQFESKMIGWLKDNFEDIPELCNIPEDKLCQSLRPAKGDENYFGNIGII